MKKYITVAALLAAGAAFANAADVVAVFNCGGTGDRARWMDQTKGWTLAQMGSENGNFDRVGEDGGIKLSLTGTGLASTGEGGSFWANIAGGSRPYPIQPELEKLSQGVFDGSTDYDTLWGGSVNMWGTNSATLTLSDLEANTKYTVYLFSARANAYDTPGTSVVWSADSSVSADWSVWTLSDNVATPADGSSTVQFDGGLYGDNASIVEVTFTTGAEQTAVSFSTSGAPFTLNGIVVETSSIPEPSAFGLLAGLGALALVASRRRRK